LLQASYLTIRATTQPTSRWITLTASYYRALNNSREFFFSLLFIFFVICNGAMAVSWVWRGADDY
jgi:hypothetical protein